MLPRPLCMSWNDQAHKQLHISLSLRPGVKDINIGKNRLFTKKTSNGLKEIAKGYKLSYVWEIAWSVFMLLSLCGPQIYPREIVHLFFDKFYGLVTFTFFARSVRFAKDTKYVNYAWCCGPCDVPSQEWHFIYFLLQKIWKFVLLLFGGGVARFTPKFGSVTAWGQIKLCCAV